MLNTTKKVYECKHLNTDQNTSNISMCGIKRSYIVSLVTTPLVLKFCFRIKSINRIRLLEKQ